MSLSLFAIFMPITPTPISGGGSSSQTTACSGNDPKVQEEIERTLQIANSSPNSAQAIAYQISRVMSDPSLTQQQKDEYIAALLGMANGDANGCRSVSPEQAEAINRAFNEIGNTFSGENTPELRQQVTDSIARNVSAGRLGADELYGLVREPGTAGARQLLTGIEDGKILADVSKRLLADARREGYDINKYQNGPALLTAAADIANLAAGHGDTSAANDVLGEIDTVMKQGPVAGDMTLVQAMMATSCGGLVHLPARDGFHALAALLNSSSSNATNQEAQDRLFAALARSGNDGYAGGIDQSGERTSALEQLGKYFEQNFSRLAEADWRKTNTGDFHHGLIKDFMRYVLLDTDYKRVDQTNHVIATEMRHLVDRIGNDNLPQDARETAASTLGSIMGSLEWATADFIEHAHGDADAKVQLIRLFSDKLTSALISAGPGKVPGGSEVSNHLVDEIWENIANRMASGEVERGEGVTNDMIELSRIFRDAMSNGDTSLLTAFDLREDLYYDPDE